MKKIRKINEAEGIFLPCFNQLMNDLNEFSAMSCIVKQSWDSVMIESKEKSFSLIWTGTVAMESYDTVLIFINEPAYMTMDVVAKINGAEKLIVSGVKGDSVPIEVKGYVGRGKLITGITFNFNCGYTDFTKQHITLYWIGVKNSEKEIEIERALPHYTKNDWTEYIREGIMPTAKKNVLFDIDDIQNIKDKLKEKRYGSFFDGLYSQADKIYQAIEPERDIREYLPVEVHLYRYVRVRDRGRELLSPRMLTLAIAGFLFEKPEWSYMSARILMCIVKTPNWFEGPQCCMEDSTWHHVCFVEERTVINIAVATGFLGGIFTEKALHEIHNAMEKHYKTIVKCCLEEGYRYYMNQGMVECAGWMVGACWFELMEEGAYGTEIEQCFMHHTRMIEGYINKEYHCTEGIAYYMYAISQSIMLWKAYAKYKKLSLKDCIPARVAGTTYYLDCLMSSISGEGDVILLGQTKDTQLDVLILSVFVSQYGWSKGLEILNNKALKQQGVEINPISQLMLLSTREMQKDGVDKKSGARYFIFEKSGLGAYEFENGKFWFSAERNPRTGHYHSDRGSILLEAFGEMVLGDPGVTNYANMMSVYMRNEEYHNLAHPEGIPMVVQSKIAKTAANEAGIGCQTKLTMADFAKPESKIHYIQKTENGIAFSADMEDLYGDSVLAGVREGMFREVSSGGEFSVCDRWKFKTQNSLYINFMSYGDWEINGNIATTRINKVTLILEFHSEQEFVLMSDDSMKDANMRQMYRLRLKTVAACKHIVECAGRVESGW